MKRGRFWLISGLLLIAAALCLIGYDLLDAKRADEASAKILRQIEPQIDPDPKQVKEMVTGEWDLTLFTCTLGNESRIAVRCDRLE